MAVRITCPNPDCRAVATVEEQSLGRRGRCKKCGHVFELARPGGEAASAISGDTSAWKGSSQPTSPTNLPEQFGRYRIMKQLGQGGMGAVYLAQDIKLNRQVALKVPFFNPSDGPQAIQRFEREARAVATLDHPNLCPIFDVGEVDGIPYLTMPYIEGKTLSDAMNRDQIVTEPQAAALIRKLALALHEAHEKGIIHRDLKPGNIMVNRRRELIIMDFGLARVVDADDKPITRTGHVLGTALYMAPEQAAGDITAIGPASDVYSLGVMLYELLTGRRPFEGPWSLVIGLKNVMEPAPPSQYRANLSPALNAITLKAIAKDPKTRYASMAEFAEALNAFLSQRSPTAPAVPSSGTTHPNKGAESLAAQVFAGVITEKVTSLRDPSPAPRPEPEGPERSSSRTSSRTWIIGGVGIALLLLGVVVIYGATSNNRKRSDDSKAVAKADRKQGRLEPNSREPSPRTNADLITNYLGMKFRLIQAGEFAMGSDESDPDGRDFEKVDGKKHQVRISKPFYLGSTEVTVGQFRKFVEKMKYRTEGEKDGGGGSHWVEDKATFEGGSQYIWRSPGFPQTDEHPVTNVSWNDAVAFCEWLSLEEGQTYRLPTEAEWEYACRAGQATRYSMGHDSELLSTVGNVADATFREKYPEMTYAIKARDGYLLTAPVGRFHPNAFGLYDMHGNVWEWCLDSYDPKFYSVSPSTDPLNAAKTAYRITRGGSWDLGPMHCRSASRDWNEPQIRACILGFRVLRETGGAGG